MVKLLFCFLNKPVSWAENSLTDFTLQYVFVCRIKADQNRTTTKKAHHNLRVGFRSKGVLVTDTQPSSCELCCNKHKQEMHGVGGRGCCQNWLIRLEGESLYLKQRDCWRECLFRLLESSQSVMSVELWGGCCSPIPHTRFYSYFQF